MKRLWPILFMFPVLLIFSCQKEANGDDQNGSGAGVPGSFEVKINGQLTSFNLTAATLIRSNADNMKRLDIAGISTDKTKRLILTIGDTPAAGNGVTVKTYIINLFNEDDPDTPEDESLGNDDGFITYSTFFGNNNSITDVYAETGTIKVTACDPNARKVTGTFSVRDSSLTGGGVILFTEGKFTNIPYQVLN